MKIVKTERGKHMERRKRGKNISKGRKILMKGNQIREE